MARSVDYDHVAKTYDRRYQENNYSGVEAALIAFVGGEHFDQRVLEVGCGTGHWLRSFGGTGIRVAGLDASGSDAGLCEDPSAESRSRAGVC